MIASHKRISFQPTHLINNPLGVDVPLLFRHLQHHNAAQLTGFVRTIDARHRHRMRFPIDRIVLTEINAVRGLHHFFNEPRAAPRIAGQIDVMIMEKRRQIHRAEAIVRHAEVAQRADRLQKVLRVQPIVRQIDRVQQRQRCKHRSGNRCDAIVRQIDALEARHPHEGGVGGDVGQSVAGHVQAVQMIERRSECGDVQQRVATQIECLSAVAVFVMSIGRENAHV